MLGALSHVDRAGVARLACPLGLWAGQSTRVHLCAPRRALSLVPLSLLPDHLDRTNWTPLPGASHPQNASDGFSYYKTPQWFPKVRLSERLRKVTSPQAVFDFGETVVALLFHFLQKSLQCFFIVNDTLSCPSSTVPVGCTSVSLTRVLRSYGAICVCANETLSDDHGLTLKDPQWR